MGAPPHSPSCRRASTIHGMSASLQLRKYAVAGLLGLMLAPALAQQAADTVIGRIHGRVINPTGMPQKNGTVSLSTDGGATLSYSFPVSTTGEYAGEAPTGEYTVVYRAPDTPEGKIVDYVREVEVVAGQNTLQDIDMTRQEFFDRLSPEQQKQLLAIRQANGATLAPDHAVVAINSDIQVVNHDFLDAQNARAAAIQSLGETASKPDIDAMAIEIETAKFTEIETLMTKDTAANPGEPVLWIDMARAELGLKNFVDAEIHYKKALDLESKAAAPRADVMAAADAGLGEVYARTLLVDEANASFDAAAKADPANAAIYLMNEAIIFFQEKNTDAQVDAADEAIKLDPSQALLYYIKAEGLAMNAAVDPDTSKLTLSPECIAALRKYLELAPTGPFAPSVTATLNQANEAIGASSSEQKN